LILSGGAQPQEDHRHPHHITAHGSMSVNTKAA
jgi:hypothetical protein